MRGKKAWLITWENFGFKHWGENEPKVVAVLPPRLPVSAVQTIVAAIWTVSEDLTLRERVAYGLNSRKANQAMWQKRTPVDGEHFFYGLKPKLYVRKVTDLRCKTTGGRDVLTWMETEMPNIDPQTGKITYLAEMEVKSWSQARS